MCLTLSDPMDCSPPGSSVHGIPGKQGLPFPTPGDLPTPRIKPASLVSPALANRFFSTVSPGLVFIPLGLLAPRRLTQTWTHDGLSVPRVRRI